MIYDNQKETYIKQKGGRNLEYQKFVGVIQQEVQKAAGEETKVSVNHILKNNIPCVDGLTILRKGENVAPAIWLRPFFSQYQCGTSIGRIAEEILEYHANMEKPARYDMNFYTDYEKVKNHIACKLVHAGMNKALLKEVPHRYFLDLALVYYYKLECDTFGNASILVKNDHLKLWGITEKELNQAALLNMPELLPAELLSLAALVDEMTNRSAGYLFSQTVPMYVLTNKEKYFGAAEILLPSVCRKIGEKLQTDYYILPSSIHECMIVPVLDGLTPEGLHEMVKEINEEHVAQEEILGDSVYLYTRSGGLLTIAWKEEKTEE